MVEANRIIVDAVEINKKAHAFTGKIDVFNELKDYPIGSEIIGCVRITPHVQQQLTIKLILKAELFLSFAWKQLVN